jgi:hypothetical protein
MMYVGTLYHCTSRIAKKMYGVCLEWVVWLPGSGNSSKRS